MHSFVIDASVALKWFPVGDEEFVEESRNVWKAICRRSIQAYAPTFLLVEVTNILAKKKKVNALVLKKIVNSLINSEIKFVSLETSDLERLGDLVVKYGMTAYDAQYVLLAEQKRCKVMAADRDFLKLKALAVSVAEMAG